MDKIIIKKVYTNKKTKQKLITIPKDCDIKEGDYVKINKIKKEDTEQNGTGQSIGSTGNEISGHELPNNGF